MLTYDEHGGCYDHVPPPWGETPPDATPGQFGFAFDRFGVRVPTVLISPLIAPGERHDAPLPLNANQVTPAPAARHRRFGLF